MSGDSSHDNEQLGSMQASMEVAGEEEVETAEVAIWGEEEA